MAKHVRYRLRLLIVAMLVAVSANAQQLGLKTNLLYWATTTPNVGLELQTGRKHSVQAFYGINPWKFNDNKSIRHWVVQPEYGSNNIVVFLTICISYANNCFTL